LAAAQKISPGVSTAESHMKTTDDFQKFHDELNKFPLVRRPSSAVEKAAPGAKRILSGMIADTLDLATSKEVAVSDEQVESGF